MPCCRWRAHHPCGVGVWRQDRGAALPCRGTAQPDPLPNKEAALFFALLFGWYPLARPKLQHLRRKPLRVVLKLVLFNAALAVIIALLLFVLVSPDWQADAANWTGLVVAGMLVLGNVAFLIYDVLLARISDLYVYRLRPKLFPRHFS